MAVKQASEKVLAVVETVTKPKPSQYGSGSYQSVLFLRYDREGDEAKVWIAMGEANAKLFRRGQQVYLSPIARDGKQSWDVEVIDAPTPLPGEQPSAPRTADQPGAYRISDEQKQSIAAYVSQMADLLGYCRTVAIQKLGDVDEETIRASTATLFITAQRRFNL